MQVKALVTVLKYMTRFHLKFTNVWVPLDGDIPADSRWASTCVSTQCLPSSVSSVTIESHKHTRPHTKTEKFRIATAYLKQLADEISDCGEKLFVNYEVL